MGGKSGGCRACTGKKTVASRRSSTVVWGVAGRRLSRALLGGGGLSHQQARLPRSMPESLAVLHAIMLCGCAVPGSRVLLSALPPQAAARHKRGPAGCQPRARGAVLLAASPACSLLVRRNHLGHAWAVAAADNAGAVEEGNHSGFAGLHSEQTVNRLGLNDYQAAAHEQQHCEQGIRGTEGQPKRG